MLKGGFTMNKNLFHKFLLRVLTLICTLALLSSCALADTYTTDEALQLVGTEAGRANGGRLELTDDFSMYDPLHPDAFSSDGGKIIILWREDAPREYAKSDETFPSDYDGVMIGEPTVYLCADLMERLPEEVRAATLAEADTIIIAETNYEFSATAVTYLGGSDSNMPSAAELNDILEAEAAGEETDSSEELTYSHEYRPMFDCWMYVSVYSTETLGCSYWGNTYYPFRELRANPEADDLWARMMSLFDLMAATVTEDADERFSAQLDVLLSMDDSFLTEEESESLVGLIFEDDVEGTLNFCWEKFWTMALELPVLDSKCADMYNQAIAEQSINALSYIVNTRSFSSFNRSDLLISANREHLGTPDLNELETMLQDAFTGLEENFGWDMAALSALLNDY